MTATNRPTDDPIQRLRDAARQGLTGDPDPRWTLPEGVTHRQFDAILDDAAQWRDFFPALDDTVRREQPAALSGSELNRFRTQINGHLLERFIATIDALKADAARQRARTCRDCVCGHCDEAHDYYRHEGVEVLGCSSTRCRCRAFTEATEQATGAGE